MNNILSCKIENKTLAYVNDGQIITQDIGGSKMTHWYDHYFLVYGYRQLKNKALQYQSLRTDFLHK
jgi:hypothetical protein